MAAYTPEERKFLIREYFLNQRSIPKTIQAWKEYNKTKTPSAQTVKNIIERFEVYNSLEPANVEKAKQPKPKPKMVRMWLPKDRELRNEILAKHGMVVPKSRAKVNKNK